MNNEQKIGEPLIAKKVQNNTINKDDEDVSVEIDVNEKQKIAQQQQGGKKQTQVYDLTEHLMTFDEIAKKFETDVNTQEPQRSKGLTHEQARERLEKYGKNMLKPPPQKPEWRKYLEQYMQGFMVLMSIAGIMACIAYAMQPGSDNLINLETGFVLFIVVIFNCTVAYYEERKSGNVMAQFKKMLPPKTRVIRDGKEDIVAAEDIVLGDICKVVGGDRVPADLIVIQCSSLKVEQSAITGEAESIVIGTESQSENFLESKNLIFNGCFCLEGSALGVVVRTGDNSYIGTIAQATTITEGTETTLHREVNLFVKLIVIISLITATLLFVIGVVRGENVFTTFVQGFIIVIVANIPQGLPITVTMLLTITAKKLAKKNVFVKTLEGVETLGSTTTIASDKTGTLTQNKMTVQNLWFDQQVYNESLFTSGFDQNEQIKNLSSFQELYKIACCCNKAFFQEEVEDVVREVRKSMSLGKAPLMGKKSGDNSGRQNRSSFQQNQTAVALLNKPEMAREIYPNVSGQMKAQLNEIIKEQEEEEKLKDNIKKTDPVSMFHQQNVNEGYRKRTLSRKRDKSMGGKDEQNMNPQQLLHMEIQQQNFLRTQAKKRGDKVIGDASEIALLRFCDKVTDSEEYRQINEKIFEVPFNSKNKYQLSIHHNQQTNQRFLVLKGAPEIVIKMCSTYQYQGQQQQITEEFLERFNNAYKQFGKQGERVLGFAMIPVPVSNVHYDEKDKNYPTHDLIFVGLMSLIDPPKNGVPEAVELCRRAGIRVAMITGDHPFTAEAIARKVGIIRDFETKEDVAARLNCAIKDVPLDDIGASVTYGPDLFNFTQEDWDNVIKNPELVFARITPQQKVEIVEQFQKFGEVVAVTGDGVNDSIALKRADIGVAMGIAGNEVAKAAADMILMDDNFASIVLGIQTGRVLFDNLKKSIAYTLTHLLPELVPIAMTLAGGFPLGMNPLIILTIDLFTEQGPAIALAYEKQEDDIMDRPPRNAKTDKLVGLKLLSYSYVQAGIFESLICVMAYFSVFMTHGINIGWLPGLYIDGYFANTTTDPWKCDTCRDYRVFSVSDQKFILAQVQCCFYLMVVFTQFFHVWVVKTRSVPLIEHGIFGSNKWVIVGVIAELIIVCFVIYFPYGVQDFFQSTNLPAKYWLWGLLSWAVFWTYNEGKKYWIRKYPNGKVKKYFWW